MIRKDGRLKSVDHRKYGLVEWLPLSSEEKDKLLAAAPSSSGIYAIRQSETIGRLKWGSDIMYIGPAEGELRNRFRGYLRAGSSQYTNQRINHLMQSYDREIAWSTTGVSSGVRSVARSLLADYDELPPANRSMAG